MLAHIADPSAAPLDASDGVLDVPELIEAMAEAVHVWIADHRREIATMADEADRWSEYLGLEYEARAQAKAIGDAVAKLGRAQASLARLADDASNAADVLDRVNQQRLAVARGAGTPRRGRST